MLVTAAGKPIYSVDTKSRIRERAAHRAKQDKGRRESGMADEPISGLPASDFPALVPSRAEKIFASVVGRLSRLHCAVNIIM